MCGSPPTCSRVIGHERSDPGLRFSAPPARWARNSCGCWRIIPGSRWRRWRPRRPAQGPYEEVVRWREPTPLPAACGRRMCPGLRSPVARTDRLFRARCGGRRSHRAGVRPGGRIVVTNTRTHRMDPDVPLLIPEVNADHLALVDCQRECTRLEGCHPGKPELLHRGHRSGTGPAAPRIRYRTAFRVHDAGCFGRRLSRRGRPSISSGMSFPTSAAKRRRSSGKAAKFLARWPTERSSRRSSPSASTPIGCPSWMAIWPLSRLDSSAGLVPKRRSRRLREFRGPPEVARLPHPPLHRLKLDARTDRPQPRLDLERGNGMAVTVGRVRPCPVLDLRMVVLGHNTVRGAAGQGVQIAELLVADEREPDDRLQVRWHIGRRCPGHWTADRYRPDQRFGTAGHCGLRSGPSHRRAPESGTKSRDWRTRRSSRPGYRPCFNGMSRSLVSSPMARRRSTLSRATLRHCGRSWDACVAGWPRRRARRYCREG